ncbi:hypothetical protein IFM89_000484 [Coptis chinensis]|uniref:60S ribosomal protein L5 n=1 Tax=Coptis chinensis TaxID=261450 RepID=A0A835H0R9_9MAGN|nr:hypothetical protein IFM89_000484 [Coptis chinensis]
MTYVISHPLPTLGPHYRTFSIVSFKLLVGFLHEENDDLISITSGTAGYELGISGTKTGLVKLSSLKGALDGGLDIPHSDKRFAGFKKENKQLDAGVHRKYVYGGHVAAYMMTLIEDEPEKYQTHFSEYIKKGIEADGIEELYRKVHASIRADPTT